MGTGAERRKAEQGPHQSTTLIGPGAARAYARKPRRADARRPAI